METSSALFLVSCVCFIFVPTLSLTANVTVSLDGTANYTSIGAAISAAPNNSEFAYSIYVKQGTYFEKVSIGMEKTHLILIGDGMGKTIITYNNSNSTGSSTSKSYTVGEFHYLFHSLIIFCVIYVHKNRDTFVIDVIISLLI